MTGLLKVIDPGPLATVQDRGRIRHQRFGVSTAGALDLVSLTIANRLVGNAPHAAAIEFTLIGGSYEIDADQARLAVAGGDFSLWLDDRPVEAYRSHTLARGQRLKIGGAANAARGYLAVDGGFALAPMLDSLSTDLRSGFGGYEGRALRAGDLLPLANGEAPRGPDLRLDPRALPPRTPPIRVVLGPQDDYFSAAGIETFLTSTYAITAQADRMGYRLAGPIIAHKSGYNIISDGTSIGSVQVPGSGQPIILLADRPPTGGYPKIATVITPDIPTLAQLKPGASLRFATVDIAEARRLRLARDAWLSAIDQQFAPVAARGGLFDSEHLLRSNLIGGVVDGRHHPE